MLPCFVKDSQAHYFMLHICWLPWQPHFWGNSQVRWLLSAPKEKKKKKIGPSLRSAVCKRNQGMIKRLWLSLVVLKMVTKVSSMATHTLSVYRDKLSLLQISRSVSQSLLLNLLNTFSRGQIKRLSCRFSRISVDIPQLKKQNKNKAPTGGALCKHDTIITAES